MSEDNGGSSEEELDLMVACPDCGATGRLEGSFCPICVGKGRIDPVIWREPDGSASFRDLAFSSWPAIVAGEQYFGLDISPKKFGPNVGHVIALLRRGEPVPKDGQRFLADLLEKLTAPKGKRKRGTPKKPPGQLERDHLRDAAALLKEITSIRQALTVSERPAPWAAAYRKYARQQNITPKSAQDEVLTARQVVRNRIEECERIFAQAGHPLGNEAEEEFLAPLKALIPRK